MASKSDYYTHCNLSLDQFRDYTTQYMGDYEHGEEKL
jgi:hypothetical protein